MPLQGRNKAEAYYKLMEAFKLSEWKQFVRQKLGLNEATIEEIEHDYRGVKEKKYQMIIAWEQKGSANNPEKLYQLKDEFFGRLPASNAAEIPAQTNHRMKFRQFLLRMSAMLSDSELRGMNHVYHYSTSRHFDTALELLCFLDDNNVLGDTSTQAGVGTALANLRSNMVHFGKQNVIDEIDRYLGVVPSGTSVVSETTQRLQVAPEPPPTCAQPHATGNAFQGDAHDTKLLGSGPTPERTEPAHEQTGLNHPVQESMPSREMPMEASVADVCTFEGAMRVESATRESYERHRADDDIYTIEEHTPKGKVLILSNTKGFSWGKNHDRLGGKRDENLMKDMWEQMQCQVVIVRNKKAPEMLTTLHQFSKDHGHAHSSFCVVIVMTHGSWVEGEGSVMFGVDGKYIRPEHVLSCFDNRNCPLLAGKPKLFFFQACRGVQADRGVMVDDKLSETISSLLPRDQTDADGQQHLPTRTDMLVAYATLERNKAFRDMTKGSWFINAIANIFMRSAKNTHVVDMLTKVKRGLISRTSNTPGDSGSHMCKEMADVQDLFTRSLYLFPGLP